RFHHGDRIGLAEGYHDHQYSPENQEAALDFLDRFNGMPARHGLPPVKELDDKALQCTRMGQVILDFENARSLMDAIQEYYLGHKSQPAKTLKQFYEAELYPGISLWKVSEFKQGIPGSK